MTNQKKVAVEPTSPSKTPQTSIVVQILKEITDFKGWDIIFQVLFYSFVLWALYNLKIIYDFHTGAEWAEIPKYPIGEFKLAILMAAVFLGYKASIRFLLFDFLKSKLDPVKFPTEEDKATRAKIACNWSANVIYYSISTSAVFILFRNEDFFPKVLGGNGEISDLFEGVPAKKDIPYAVTFYMIQFGYHVYTLIDYCVYKWNTPKFWEMFLHHSMAVFLMFFSYLTGNVRVGIMVLVVHDPADIFLCFGRIFADWKVKLTKLRNVNYFFFVLSWLFLRLYVFPKYIVGGGFDAFLTHDCGSLTSPMLFLILMLAALVILHAYWFFFVLQVFIAMLNGKERYNVYDNAKKEKEKTKSQQD